MTDFQADWLDDGEPMPVRPLPFKGVKEVGELRKERSSLAGKWGRLLSFYTYGTMLGVQRMMNESGVEPAMKAWETGLTEMGVSQAAVEELMFDEEDFEEEFNNLVDQRVRPNVDPRDGESLRDCLQRRMDEELSDTSLSELKREITELQMEQAATELYWRHKNQDHVIIIEGEEEEWSVENLMEVMSFEDWANYRKALTEEGLRKHADPNDEVDEVLTPKPDEVVEKNSPTPSTTSSS